MKRGFDEQTCGWCRPKGLVLIAAAALALWAVTPSRGEEEEAEESESESAPVSAAVEPAAGPAAKTDKPANKDAKIVGGAKADDKRISPAEQLGFQQAEVTAQMAELEQRMFRLGETLKSLEPENSSRLMLGLKFAREELVLHQMKEIQEQLQKASLGESLIEQKQLLSKLERLEQLLLSADLDFQMRLQRLRQIREILRRLEPIIREEDREQKLSDQTVAREAKAAELARSRANLEELIRRQTAHLDRSRALAKDPASDESKAGWRELAAEQGKTQEQTAALLPAEINVPAPEATPAEQKAPAEEKPAAEDKAANEEKPATDAPAEEKDAVAEKPATEKLASEEKSPADKKPPADEKAPAENKTPAGSQALADASREMLAAKAKLEGDEPAKAEPSIDGALTILRSALADLERQQAGLAAELAADKFVGMAKDQSANRQSTDGINEMVRGLGDSGAAALAELIKSGGNMTNAEGDLRGMQPGAAGKQQELALVSLKYARELLAEEAARLQDRLRAEVKKRVLEGLMLMLDQQVVIRQSTESLSARVAQKSRQAEASVIGLSRSEVKVIALADELITLVEETEFGIALPAATRIIRDEMDGVRGSLAAALAGEEVVSAEKEIEGDLQSLIDAMKQMPSAGRDRSAGKRRAANDDEQRRELNRLIAELKMVRLLETRLYQNTTAADRDRAGTPTLPAALRRQIIDLGGRQEDVRDVTEKLAIERGADLNQ